MSKTIEEIKNEYAKELGYSSWINIGYNADSEKRNNEVAKRYAQSQTQELQEQNAELVEMLSLVCMDLEERGRAYGDAYTMSKELLTKYNHLNKKP